MAWHVPKKRSHHDGGKTPPPAGAHGDEPKQKDPGQIDPGQSGHQDHSLPTQGPHPSTPEKKTDSKAEDAGQNHGDHAAIDSGKGSKPGSRPNHWVDLPPKSNSGAGLANIPPASPGSKSEAAGTPRGVTPIPRKVSWGPAPHPGNHPHPHLPLPVDNRDPNRDGPDVAKPEDGGQHAEKAPDQRKVAWGPPPNRDPHGPDIVPHLLHGTDKPGAHQPADLVHTSHPEPHKRPPVDWSPTPKERDRLTPRPDQPASVEKTGSGHGSKHGQRVGNPHSPHPKPRSHRDGRSSGHHHHHHHPELISPRTGRLITNLVCFAYLGLAILVGGLFTYAEAWWPGTLVLFSPRWVLWIPLVIVGLFWLFFQTRLGLVALLVAVVVVWPIAGFNIPWKKWFATVPEGTTVNFTTINMHSNKVYPKELERFLKSTTTDVIAIQNWDAAEQSSLNHLPGWFVHQSKSHYLASRFPIKKAVELGGDSRGDKGAVFHYELDTPMGTLHVFSLHFATNRDGLRNLIKSHESGPDLIQNNSNMRQTQANYVAGQVQLCDGPVVIMGDFNTPVESPHFIKAWKEFQNAFDQAGWGWGYSFFGDNTMVRIDHILASHHWSVSHCIIGPRVGSPHRPVCAELVFQGK